MKMLKKIKSQNKGFTLIELMIVVTIIALLSAIGIVSMGPAIAKSRDARRKADVKAITNALELYYIDNGVYPTVGCWAISSTAGDWLGAGLSPKYLKVAPKDPNNNAATGRYYYVCSPWGSGYIVFAIVENPLDPDVVGTKARDDSGNVWGPVAGYYIKGKQ